MKKATAFIAASLMAIFAVRYCYLIAIGETKPVLATWLMFSLATTAGMWTYLRTDYQKDWVTNIANTVDVFVTLSIMFFLLFFGRGIRYDFTPLEAVCITAVLLVLLYWKISHRANIANVAVNTILVVGYFPTVISLWVSNENTESFSAWVIVLVSNFAALYNPIRERDWLALLYATRSVVSVGIVLGLMAYNEFHQY